jgi:RNA polymerase sigma factor (sigma-70 family)
MSNQNNQLIAFISKERRALVRYVRRKITDISEMDAEDIVADVVFNIYNKVDIQHHVDNMLAYMYRSVRNRMNDYLRKPRSTISLEQLDQVSGLPLSESIADPLANIEEQLARADIQEKLYHALLQLEPKYRAVWVATEFEGRSFKELSEKWGEPVGTLLSRKKRAKSKLQQLLREHL